MKPLFGVLLALVACTAGAATFSDETLAVDGGKRRYLVHDFSADKPTALVILLHGGGGNGQNMAEQTTFDKVAEREGLITVYPYGSNGLFNNVLLTWNAAHCCAHAMRENVDDVRFLSLLIDHLIATRKVDPQRVYVTGLSNGGMMTHRIGIELADKVAAIAPVIASLYGDEPVREYVMPTLIINGADDQRVKVEGGELEGLGVGSAPADLPTLPISSQREYWARVNGCTDAADSSTSDYELRTYSGCRAGGAVQSYLVKNNGHAWPGGTAPRGEADQPVQTVNANELIWAFFKQYRRTSENPPAPVAWYYDGRLTIPAFTANALVYGAQLNLLTTNPIEFELLRMSPVSTGVVGESNRYQAGVMTLPAVAVGHRQYRAELALSAVNPIRLRLQELR